MKFDVLNRFTGEVQFTAEIECKDDELPSVKLGLAIEWAYKTRANLDGANLDGAYLARANLDGANLAGAYLAGANLDGANLAGAYLARANLDGAYLAGANLDGANLAGAYLARANLDGAYLARANLDGKKLIGERPILQIGGLGSRNAYLVSYNTEDGIKIKAGCFFGTLEEFENSVKEKHGDNQFGKEYAAAILMIKSHAEIWKP